MEKELILSSGEKLFERGNEVEKKNVEDYHTRLSKYYFYKVVDLMYHRWLSKLPELAKGIICKIEKKIYLR